MYSTVRRLLHHVGIARTRRCRHGPNSLQVFKPLVRYLVFHLTTTVQVLPRRVCLGDSVGPSCSKFREAISRFHGRSFRQFFPSPSPLLSPLPGKCQLGSCRQVIGDADEAPGQVKMKPNPNMAGSGDVTGSQSRYCGADRYSYNYLASTIHKYTQWRLAWLGLIAPCLLDLGQEQNA